MTRLVYSGPDDPPGTGHPKRVSPFVPGMRVFSCNYSFKHQPGLFEAPVKYLAATVMRPLKRGKVLVETDDHLFSVVHETHLMQGEPPK